PGVSLRDAYFSHGGRRPAGRRHARRDRHAPRSSRRVSGRRGAGRMSPGQTVLSFENVYAGYARAAILHDVSFRLATGDTLALLGRNGVGKSTLIATIMGAARLQGGAIYLEGKNLAAIPPQRRAAAGLGWVAQER